MPNNLRFLFQQITTETWKTAELLAWILISWGHELVGLGSYGSGQDHCWRKEMYCKRKTEKVKLKVPSVDFTYSSHIIRLFLSFHSTTGQIQISLSATTPCSNPGKLPYSYETINDKVNWDLYLPYFQNAISLILPPFEFRLLFLEHTGSIFAI